MKNKKKKKNFGFERPTEFEFYHMLKFAIQSLPKKVKKEISGFDFVLVWDVVKWRGKKTPMAEAHPRSKNIVIYPHEVVFHAGIERKPVVDALISIVEHEVAHVYGLGHKDINWRRKKKMPMFEGLELPKKAIMFTADYKLKKNGEIDFKVKKHGKAKVE